MEDAFELKSQMAQGFLLYRANMTNAKTDILFGRVRHAAK